MTRTRYKLSARQIKSIGAGKHGDGAGLYLKKRSKDSGRWLFIYTQNHRKREMGLGGYPAVSLSRARAERDRWEEELNVGNDPIDLRSAVQEKQRQERERPDPFFCDAVTDYLNWGKAGLKRDGEAGRWRSPIDRHALPKLGKKRVSTLTTPDITRVLEPLWHNHQPTAKKLYQRIRMVLKRCQMLDMQVDPSIVDKAVGKLPVVQHKTKGIQATPWNEIPIVFAQLDKAISSHLALRFLMLTAVRANSVCGARFDEIVGDVWTIPASRMKSTVSQAEDFRVLLPPECLQILKACRLQTAGEFLFPGRRQQPIHGNALLKSLNDLGIAGRPHGYRSAFKDWCRIHHPDLTEIAEECLAHKVGNKTARAYHRSELLEVRGPLLASWAAYVASG